MALVKEKIKETMYAREHLRLVMNLDFTKPTQKLREMAATNKIDLNDPDTIAEFKKIQQHNLEDIQAMKEGRQPPTVEERMAEDKKRRDAAFEQKMEEFKRREKENQEKFNEYIKKT